MELWDLTLENPGGRPRSLSVYSYAEFSYHQIPIDNQNFQMSLCCAGSSYKDGVIDYALFYEDAHQFMAASFAPDGFDCLRDSFIGPYRTESNPLAVERGACFGSFEKWQSNSRKAIKTDKKQEKKKRERKGRKENGRRKRIG